MEYKKLNARSWLVNVAKKEYGTEEEHPWEKHSDGSVLRHSGSKKCYAIFMVTSYRSLGLENAGQTDIVNLKVGPVLAGSLISEPGILPAYHMSRGKESWVTALLDGSVPKKTLLSLLGISYQATGRRAARSNGNNFRISRWIIPANPRYFDLETVLHEDKNGTFLFKQSSGICIGDTVYIYVAAPVSAICYTCEAVAVKIPETYEDEHVKIRRLMRLKMLKRYPNDPIPLSLMREYGVTTVRGPRSMPKGLEEEIQLKTET